MSGLTFMRLSFFSDALSGALYLLRRPHSGNFKETLNKAGAKRRARAAQRVSERLSPWRPQSRHERERELSLATLTLHWKPRSRR